MLSRAERVVPHYLEANPIVNSAFYAPNAGRHAEIGAMERAYVLIRTGTESHVMTCLARFSVDLSRNAIES